MKENVSEPVFLLSVYFISILSVRSCVCICVPVPQMIQYKKNKVPFVWEGDEYERGHRLVQA